jgi:hypothetical protein
MARRHPFLAQPDRRSIRGQQMNKAYSKPTLIRRERLGRIAASLVIISERRNPASED